MLKLGLAFALALAITGCATDAGSSDPQIDTQEMRLLGTWLGDLNGSPTQFSFVDDGSVTETLMDDGRQFQGTFDLVADQLTLDFGGGDPATYRIEISENGDLEFVDVGASFQSLSSCGGPNGDGI